MQDRTLFGHQLKHTAVERHACSREMVGQTLPTQRPTMDGPRRRNGIVGESDAVAWRCSENRRRSLTRRKRSENRQQQSAIKKNAWHGRKTSLDTDDGQPNRLRDERA